MSSVLDAADPTGEAAKRRFARARPALSLVIPTRNEAGNIVALMKALDTVLVEHGMQVIFVDDSDDGTDAVVRGLTPARHLSVELIHRVGDERVGGLGGAVVAGMEAAAADWICVMDADLQHPPSLISELYERAGRGDVDIVVASRFTGDGSAEEFGPLRRLLSRTSTMAAERLFARQLAGITDPMSGFFMVRRSAIELDDLRPKGFKILLEVLVRTRQLRKAEVPFAFGVRHSGESKASAAEGARYLGQLWRLRFADVSARFGRFGVVGLTGLVVNMLALALLSNVVGIWYLAAAVLATQVSTVWNFVLTDRWVFRRIDPALSLPGRLLSFGLLNNLALLLRVPILLVLVAALGADPLVANLVSLLALSLIRFGVSDSMIWAARNPTARFNYDIHGIISVASDGLLPELERFRVRAELADPTIRVRIGRVKERGVGARELDGDRTFVHYVEKFGNLGFAAELTLGERIDITAAPLLRRSPHVLYTNIVEPVLRWAFVERGYALVHAACMASEQNGFLITARTDTGKTTTALKTLDSLPFSFLSDDLTLLTPDGRVLTYPKPLTISRHTLSAVKTPLLTRKERTKLIVQSRLHSKSGRLFGLIIAKTGMPAATMNALVQMIVPPPKFQVDRLVPHVAIKPEADVKGMAIIQREGEEGAVLLEEEEALDILLANCEDAYGFPPYPIIQKWLHSRNGKDLRTTERHIITAALSGKPSQLLRSYQRDWYQMFPAMIERAVAIDAAKGPKAVAPAFDAAPAG